MTRLKVYEVKSEPPGQLRQLYTLIASECQRRDNLDDKVLFTLDRLTKYLITDDADTLCACAMRLRFTLDLSTNPKSYTTSNFPSIHQRSMILIRNLLLDFAIVSLTPHFPIPTGIQALIVEVIGAGNGIPSRYIIEMIVAEVGFIVVRIMLNVVKLAHDNVSLHCASYSN